MTEEKCYSLEKDGSYCLGFPNRSALTEEEIKDIFSEYGTVISVRTSGDERGFRFVRYRSLAEAENAIDGLKGSKQIRILPKKPKVQSNDNDKGAQRDNQRNAQQKGIKRKDFPYKKKDEEENWNDDPPVSQSPIFNNSTNKDVVNDSIRFSWNDDGNNHRELKTVIKKINSRLNQDKEKNEKKVNDAFKPDELAVHKSPIRNKFRQHEQSKTKIHNDMIDSTDKRDNDDKPLQRPRCFKQNRGNHSSSDISTESASKLQEGAVATELPKNIELPDLVTTEELKQRSVKGSVCGEDHMKIVIAEEVIIANVHENFSVLYILWLLEKFEPICVTEMKTIAKNGVRYCSVYFRSQKAAIEVEKKFDKFNLSGNKLIVRTPELLINEVAAA